MKITTIFILLAMCSVLFSDEMNENEISKAILELRNSKNEKEQLNRLEVFLKAYDKVRNKSEIAGGLSIYLYDKNGDQIDRSKEKWDSYGVREIAFVNFNKKVPMTSFRIKPFSDNVVSLALME